MPRKVVVRAPAKVNLSLQVGPLQSNGYHPVETVYQAVDLYDDIIAESADDLSLTAEGDFAENLGKPNANLAWQAAALLAKNAGIEPKVHLHLVKRIPVAGGMAGGSADAAGALVACDALWGLQSSKETLLRLAAELGSDVPFSIVGGTSIGRGRGEQLTTVLARGEFFWVFAISDKGLSTPEVYHAFDTLNVEPKAPEVSTALLSALGAGDIRAVGSLLDNNLQKPAIALRGSLRRVLDAGIEAGALGAVVSGSGPTCAFLAKSADHATNIAISLASSGYVSRTVQATGPAKGVSIVSSE